MRGHTVPGLHLKARPMLEGSLFMCQTPTTLVVLLSAFVVSRLVHFGACDCWLFLSSISADTRVISSSQPRRPSMACSDDMNDETCLKELRSFSGRK